MRARITEKQLQELCDRINKASGTPMEPYARDPKTGARANAGNYNISMAYGGYALHQMQKSGGVLDVFRSGHVPKRELYERMSSFYDGIDVGKTMFGI